MAIRPKIKEICDNIDKFELNSKVSTRIQYKGIEIANSNTLYIDRTEIDLSKEEKKYLKKVAFKKWETESKGAESEEQKRQNDLLNSINFNKK